MSAPARAGIVVTGTEVLSGRVSDRNGPWLSERLFEQGLDLAHILIVGDRPSDMQSALSFMASNGIDVVLTSGGLGPTADDLTAEVVGRFQGREMVLDEALEGRIAEILAPLAKRYPKLDREAIAAGNRKQATIPRGAEVLEPVGTAPGLVVAPAEGHTGPTIVVLPGPPRELQPMWRQAIGTAQWRAATWHARNYHQRMLRLFGIPESEIAETLRVAEGGGVPLTKLEITTCLRGGEIEIVTRFPPEAEEVYDAFAAVVADRHADTLYSQDGTTIDDQVAALLHGNHTIAVAESCTGGLLAARLTNPPGASGYVLGGVVCYADELKIAELGVAAQTIERHGAVSEQVVCEMATGACLRLGADVGVAVTGIAGPGGGSEQKPVGLVWLSAQGPGGATLTRSVQLPGARSDVRERAVMVAMHLVRRLLLGEDDGRDVEREGRAGPLLR
ncbi:MAG TPA: competence/damage-inducible protein A [Solirubrobacteraceae bacterium]|nr:competence/damage-inducible protein A [Solirubrobacteraceae bacterium]